MIIKKQAVRKTGAGSSQHNWIGTSAGLRGFNLNYVVRQHKSNVELYIDRGKDSEEENKALFEKLYESKTAIESAFGGPLDWKSLEGRRACKIEKEEDGGYRDEQAAWPAIHDRLIDTMVRLEQALRPFLDKLERST